MKDFAGKQEYGHKGTHHLQIEQQQGFPQINLKYQSDANQYLPGGQTVKYNLVRNKPKGHGPDRPDCNILSRTEPFKKLQETKPEKNNANAQTKQHQPVG